MELVHQHGETDMRAFLIRGVSLERDNAEHELLDRGICLPLPQRSLWAANAYPWKPLFLLIRDGSGQACGGVGIEKIRSRTMPGHSILRVRRFGENLSPQCCRFALEALTRLAHTEPRILRVQIHLFSLHRRGEMSKDFQEQGFLETSPPSSYRYTLIVDLTPTEDDIFASFGKSARNRVRESIKKSLQSAPLENPSFAARIAEQQREAVHRTGGRVASLNWEGVLKMSREHPGLSKVFGAFVGDEQQPESMRAFAWACNHGDHVEYHAAGSTRTSDSRLPFGYSLVWAMIRWAKSAGAHWFDMGGVSLGENGSALDGISDFKRFFSQDLVEVGAEWALEPHPLRAGIARTVSRNAARVGRLLR